MSRRREAQRRAVLPDPKFGSELLSRFINQIMLDGKKSIAEKVVYGALDIALGRYNKQLAKATSDKKDEGDEGDEGGESGEGGKAGGGSVRRGKITEVELLELVLSNLRPNVEVRSRRVGGATYQVPVEVRETRRDALAMRWLVQFSRQRGEKDMVLRLANEMLNVVQGRGNSIKKRQDTHKMAEANKAFAHFRWN